MENKPIDCFKCKYMQITWDASRPRGCLAFGFKTEKIPSTVILETSGEPCHMFTPKEKPAAKDNPSNKKNGWVA
jgi:hypothetical protein